MKNKIIIAAMVLAVFCLPHTGMAQPKVIIEEAVFQFEMVPEGVLVPHEFIIKNTGDTTLHIQDVLPP